MNFSMPPISIHPENPHVFLYQGHPLLLVGASSNYMIACTLNNDMGYKRPAWDSYIEFLDDLQRACLNKTRIWAGANGWGHVLPGNDSGYAPAFYWDGEKWDLDRWNPHYFERLHTFLEASERHGIIVELTFFSQLYEEENWKQSPFHISCNHQGIGNIASDDFTRITEPGLYEYQKRFVRKLVEETNHHDNLY